MATKPSDNPLDPPVASTLPADPPKVPPKVPPKAPEIGDNGGYAGTGKTAEELVKEFGTNPDGSPATEPKPDTPSCPPVSPDGYPFDTKSIPAGCNEPLSEECVAYYNELYAPPADTGAGTPLLKKK